MHRLRFLLLAPVVLCACPSKAPPPKASAPLDKQGIQRRADSVHNDLNAEEKKDEERKSDQ
jgi:hypothetical protein